MSADQFLSAAVEVYNGFCRVEQERGVGSRTGFKTFEGNYAF